MGGTPLKMARGRKPTKPHVEKIVGKRGRKSTKTNAERFCIETIYKGNMYGCKKRNDGEFFPDACPIDSNYGCKYSGLKKRHTVKTNATEPATAESN